MIDWFSNKAHIFSNPKLELKLPSQWNGYAKLPAHIWLTSSGTKSSNVRWIANSKQAFLASAEAVNQHLNSTSKDRWGVALPIFHAGGLSIYARAALTHSSIFPYNLKWDPISYTHFLKEQAITFSSLVPTQVADLVFKKCIPPASLKAIIVGGSELHPILYEAALKLGWPLLLSYGLTECASQVATAKLGSASLKILPHINAKVTPDKRLMLKSSALLTGYLTNEQDNWIWHDPKVEGWYQTEDLVELKEDSLIHLGRLDDYIKILGEFVSLKKLEALFQQLSEFTDRACLIAVPDLRRGYRLIAVSETNYSIQAIVDTFNQQVTPFERIVDVQTIDLIPRSPLGKILKSRLLLLIEETC